ncbi:MAG: 50S ribosomal protein L6 [Candidatus Yanofskybacteria bacterium RIFCSPHIGHO2_02_FULL_41_29]|uniref:Large ribosomal subunit protein uL6 n=1 Tax=Candidatus Yanofskybacteria bacterium RIFCSPHIGHO2_01_FULL_41_53 TaxID=1802663 RepID=A0A1F8EHL3_9BACT|nr:MAG: 50S ribosomal protein L6 [Candidatus Yanofskybacteria bacterium RIFCSPHIGHO2_01_FULL_41_53]OGN11587.1 MAG: 50S ribosomal protein L6 [Candidatus Yanofskybacteria bacterium RIFCSPHIGHO2_02_FULL_41_29]OGN18842.1 MAG: 50S ribosomal protein L6 [Candidatus Yanofskybacteria bacterium RIFCSPHIGHO2_12_FULL_41_9]OGN22824.1 MAG: 50S ribosomal protein L6 [Candidatus Yanofskybacteria bacterium RIFCSPLOWO2_01_FULL_41_67]OGN30091.1 MAG: 50S ribosomal protein L6 [Candidatus Yanofskybacteria bacterium R
MSKIGKKPIQVSREVEIKVEGSLVMVKGPLGQLTKNIDSVISVAVSDGKVTVDLKNKSGDKKNLALWGLSRALIANMIRGVSEGFEKKLEFEGVGYKANVKGDELELSLGYSHPIRVRAPAGISFKVEKNVIKVTGMDNELVGQVAAEIKSKRLPEPYKGSGIKYAGEIIRRKAGKKAATAA